MRIIEHKTVMHEFALGLRAAGRTVGLVPTMGALHEGHLSLLRQAREECGAVVASLFVNPTQFAPGEDLARYPRTFTEDCEACEALGVDALFAPTDAEMCPADAETFVVQDRLTGLLEGASRPTHFRGVLTVVLKLLHVTAPHVAYFGQKDYQQTVVIRRMVADLDVPTHVCVLPTVREPDGLAMSSRNRYLGPDERRQALALSQALDHCRSRFAEGERSADTLRSLMRERIDSEPSARIDYVEIARPDSLEPAEQARPGDVALVAAFVGNTRLIDNAMLG
jgi:pantoate--beta-alanine ligase